MDEAEKEKKNGRKFMTSTIIFHSFHSKKSGRLVSFFMCLHISSIVRISYGFVTINQRLSIAADLTTCETVVYLLFTDFTSKGRQMYFMMLSLLL